MKGREGFEPGLIFVRAFAAEESELGIHRWGSYEDFIVDPDGSQNVSDPDVEVCETLQGYWMKGRNFVISLDNDYWTGPDGRIHSS